MRLARVSGEVHWQLAGVRWRGVADARLLWAVIGDGLVAMDLETGAIVEAVSIVPSTEVALAASATHVARPRGPGFVVCALPTLDEVWHCEIPARRLALSGDGAMVAGVRDQRDVVIWRVGEPAPVCELPGEYVWLSPAGDLALVKAKTTRWSSQTMLVRVATREVVRSRETRLAWAVAWGSRERVAWCDWDGRVTIWDTAGNDVAVAVTTRTVDFLDDDTLVTCNNGDVALVAAADGRVTRALPGAGNVLAIADPARLVTEHGDIRVVDTATGAIVRGREPADTPVTSIVWGPRGDIAVLRSYQAFVVWDWARWAVVRTMPEISISRASSAATAVACFAGDELAILDAEGGLQMIGSDRVRWRARVTDQPGWSFEGGELRADPMNVTALARWARSLGIMGDRGEEFESRMMVERFRIVDGGSLGATEGTLPPLDEPGEVELADRARLELVNGPFTALAVSPDGRRALAATALGVLLGFEA